MLDIVKLFNGRILVRWKNYLETYNLYFLLYTKILLAKGS